MMSFSPQTSLCWIRKPASLQGPFQIWTHLLKGTNRPKFIKWVKELTPEHLHKNLRKNLPLPTENLEEWGYSPNHDVDEEVYLAAFLVTWLSGRPLATLRRPFARRPFGWPQKWHKERDTT